MSDRLAVILAREIVSGRRESEAVFPSAEELVRLYDVSRTVAREAIHTLSMSGLLRVQHGRRSAVTVPDEWDVLSPVVQVALWQENQALPLMKDQRELLLLIEPPAAARVAALGDQPANDTIAELAWETVQSVESGASVTRIARTDHRFHLAIARASGNQVVAAVVRATESFVDHLWAAHYARYSHDELLTLSRHHVEIADAIARQDPPTASRLLHQHITAGTELALHHFRRAEARNEGNAA